MDDIKKAQERGVRLVASLRGAVLRGGLALGPALFVFGARPLTPPSSKRAIDMTDDELGSHRIRCHASRWSSSRALA